MKEFAVKAGTLITGTGEILQEAVLHCKRGKIAGISDASESYFDCPIIDASEQYVYPGFIDASSHLGVNKEPYSHYRDTLDGVDTSNPIAPELQARDSFNPFSAALNAARASGLTTCYAVVGPGALIGGQGICFKLRFAQSVDEMIIPGTEQMHFSLGTVPLETYKELHKPPCTRMGALEMLRKELDRAKENIEKGEHINGALERVLTGKMRARFYCLEAQDIAAALNLGEQYGMDYTIDGAYEAWKVQKLLNRYKRPVILNAFPFGPFQDLWRSKTDYSLTLAASIEKTGCPLILTTDSATNTRLLPYMAGLAMAHGLSEEKAIAAITLEAAKALKVDKFVGSLEVGKDADFCIYNGNALLSTSTCLQTYIDGNPVYKAEVP